MVEPAYVLAPRVAVSRQLVTLLEAPAGATSTRPPWTVKTLVYVRRSAAGHRAAGDLERADRVRQRADVERAAGNRKFPLGKLPVNVNLPA